MTLIPTSAFPDPAPDAIRVLLAASAAPGHDTCRRCRRAFEPADAERRLYRGTGPFCLDCIEACHNDLHPGHYCSIDRWHDQHERPTASGA